MTNRRYTREEVQEPNPPELIEIIKQLDTDILIKISNDKKTKWNSYYSDTETIYKLIGASHIKPPVWSPKYKLARDCRKELRVRRGDTI